MFSKLLTFLALCQLCWFGSAIDLKPIRVPSIVTEGSSIYLECKFDLEGFQLHAVKWRKNRELFYKYQPDDPLGVKLVYPIAGINVDLLYSNKTHVYLTNVDFNTQGTYSCDILSTEPYSKEVSSEDQLTVVNSDYLLTPLLATGPRSSDSNSIHKLHRLSQSSSIAISPQVQKERSTTTTLKKSSTLITNQGNSDYHQLENLRQKLSNSVDLTKLKNLNYDQNQNYYLNRDSLRLHFDQNSKKQKTIETGYFPVELGPKHESKRVFESVGQKSSSSLSSSSSSSSSSSASSSSSSSSDSLIDEKIKLFNQLKNGGKTFSKYEVEDEFRLGQHGQSHFHQNFKSKQAGIYRLTPEQYNDIKFLLKNPDDVILFKPVENNVNSTLTSASIVSKYSMSLFLTFLCLILLFI